MAETTVDWGKDCSKLTRSALGRVALIGELYDARTESFCSRSLVQRTFPPECVIRQDINKADIQFSESDQLSDRLNFLKIEAEMHLPILFGLLTLSGNGQYLVEEKKSERIVSCSLLYNVSTVCEKWLVSTSDVKAYIDPDAIEDENATHVVVEAYWGANCTLSLESRDFDASDKTQAEGLLKGKLQKLGGLLKFEGRGAGNYRDDDENKALEFNFKIHADILPDGNVPTTVKDAIDFMSRIPSMLKSVNNGKGQPLSYTLVPLSVLRQLYQQGRTITCIVNAIDESFIIGVVFFFEEVSVLKQKLNDVLADVNKSQRYLSGDLLGKIRAVQQELLTKETRLKADLAEAFVKVRSGSATMRELIRNFEKQKSNELNLVKIEESIESFLPVLGKIQFINTCLSNNVKYLSKNEDLNVIMVHNLSSDYFVLSISEELESQNNQLFRDTVHLFLIMSKERKRDQEFIVVDLDVAAKKNVPENHADKVRIIHYKAGRIVSGDVFKDREIEKTLNFARLRVSTEMELVQYKPNKRVNLELICPGFRLGICPNQAVVWTCQVCKDHLEFGFDDHFYCACGKALAGSFLFRCSDVRHGADFFPFTKGSIQNELSKLRPLKDLNVLILGQSGVGKSTWINSIVNYLHYETLEEAQRGGVVCVIPASFTVTYEGIKQQLVQIGEPDVNENQRVGTSSTRGPKTYTFLLSDRIVRLIDTPGLGDSEGIDQDKENMRQILDHISHLQEIHGICILMKSNDTVISAIFKFCIKEFLSHLNKNAARNILFCFTNSRSSFYSPGDTSVILGDLLRQSGLDDMIPLSQKTMFCLDNEAFRFLCTLKYKNIPHKEKDVKSYVDSWEISVEETKRLFDQIKSLPPHTVNDTTTLCNARNRILNLTKPIAEITQTIQLNIAAIADEERKIRTSNESLEDLAKKLYMPQIVLEPEKLDKPRTVCTSQKCVKYYQLKQTGINQIEYVTLCHVDCQLRDITPETLPNAGLLNCWAMNGGNKPNCRNCNCSWEMHMHITYEQKRVEKQVVDSTVQNEINHKTSARTQIIEHMKSLRSKTEKLTEEQQIITKTSSKFAVFLKENAISPYNDGFKEYLKYLIRLESDKVNKTLADDDLLRGLQMMMAKYEEEVKILEDSMKNVHDIDHLSPKDIADMEKELYNLPLTGEQIRKNAEMSARSNDKAKSYSEHQLPLRSRMNNFHSGRPDKEKEHRSRGLFGWVKDKLNPQERFRPIQHHTQWNGDPAGSW